MAYIVRNFILSKSTTVYITYLINSSTSLQLRIILAEKNIFTQDSCLKFQFFTLNSISIKITFFFTFAQFNFKIQFSTFIQFFKIIIMNVI